MMRGLLDATLLDFAAPVSAQQGSCTVFGPECGVHPHHVLRLYAPSPPRLGVPFDVALEHVNGGCNGTRGIPNPAWWGFLFTGVSNTTWAGGALPFRRPLGAARCSSRRRSTI